MIEDTSPMQERRVAFLLHPPQKTSVSPQEEGENNDCHRGKKARQVMPSMLQQCAAIAKGLGRGFPTTLDKGDRAAPP